MGVERNWLQIFAPLPLKNFLELKPLSPGSISVDSNFKLATRLEVTLKKENKKKDCTSLCSIPALTNLAML
jgi:hypothetical protein